MGILGRKQLPIDQEIQILKHVLDFDPLWFFPDCRIWVHQHIAWIEIKAFGRRCFEIHIFGGTCFVLKNQSLLAISLVKWDNVFLIKTHAMRIRWQEDGTWKIEIVLPFHRVHPDLRETNVMCGVQSQAQQTDGQICLVHCI